MDIPHIEGLYTSHRLSGAVLIWSATCDQTPTRYIAGVRPIGFVFLHIDIVVIKLNMS